MGERLVLSVREVQEALNLSRSSVYEGIAQGTIPSIRVGKRILVPRAALQRLLEEAG